MAVGMGSGRDMPGHTHFVYRNNSGGLLTVP
jgi:hypothetical protein